MGSIFSINYILKETIKIFFDFENIYNLIYVAVTFICYYYPILYCVLLLDIVKRSIDLKNVVRL